MQKNNKKKILHFVEAMGGGVFTYMVDLSNNLAKDEYDVYIAYAIRPQTPIDYKRYFDKRVTLIEVKNFTRSIHPLRDIAALFEMKKIIKNIRPDLIHLHSSKAGVLGRIGLKNTKIPFFYTPHGYSFLMADSSRQKRLLYREIEKICGKNNCTTIACSEGEYEQSLKVSKKSTYVNNGININALQKIIDETLIVKETKRKYTVFTLGRICYQKNPELFNAIAEQLPDVRFVWIGDGELRDKLVSNNIEVTGWVERSKALAHAVNADSFILTSLWEGLPISLLEAMYMKKVCIVSDVIGNKDVIKNEVNGFVCNDVDEFVQCIRVCSEKLQIEIVEKAYKDITSEYNTDIMSQKYNEIYSKGVY